MDMSGILGIVAGVIHTIAYLDYNRQILRGTLKPNGPTWAIWAFIAALSAGSYVTMADDWAKSILPLTNIALCIGTFLIACAKKTFEKPDWSDFTALVIGFSSTFVWWYWKSAAYANIVLQVAIIIGFIPTLRLVWRNPEKESVRPWVIWTVGYVFLVTVVVIRWNGNWLTLVYPMNCIVFHGSVAVLLLLRTQALSLHESCSMSR